MLALLTCVEGFVHCFLTHTHTPGIVNELFEIKQYERVHEVISGMNEIKVG